MIDRAVESVVGRLNDHLRSRFRVADDLAVATTLVDSEGKPVAAARNQLCVFVTNISHDASLRSRGGRGGGSLDGIRGASSAPPVNIDLFLMLASNFDAQNYLESLKILSGAIQFFQATPVFDHANAPELDHGIGQLSFEIHNMDVETLSQLWGALGGRYMPSILYKVRTIAIDSGALTDEPLVIRRPETSAVPQAVGSGG